MPQVRILSPGPRRRGLHVVRDDFFSKSHLSLAPSLLLSKCDPLGLGSHLVSGGSVKSYTQIILWS